MSISVPSVPHVTQILDEYKWRYINPSIYSQSQSLKFTFKRYLVKAKNSTSFAISTSMCLLGTYARKCLFISGLEVRHLCTVNENHDLTLLPLTMVISLLEHVRKCFFFTCIIPRLIFILYFTNVLVLLRIHIQKSSYLQTTIGQPLTKYVLATS